MYGGNALACVLQACSNVVGLRSRAGGETIQENNVKCRVFLSFPHKLSKRDVYKRTGQVMGE